MSYSDQLQALPPVVRKIRKTLDELKSELEAYADAAATGSGNNYSVVTAATDGADGTCAVQFTFKDADGNALTAPISGLCYLSEAATGLTHNLADTSLAVLTNGALTNIGGAGPSLFTTTAAGLLGMTITAANDDYYVVFVQPDGTLLISDVCAVSGN